MPDAKAGAKVVHFRKSELAFGAYGGPPGKATIALLVTRDHNQSTEFSLAQLRVA